MSRGMSLDLATGWKGQRCSLRTRCCHELSGLAIYSQIEEKVKKTDQMGFFKGLILLMGV